MMRNVEAMKCVLALLACAACSGRHAPAEPPAPAPVVERPAAPTGPSLYDMPIELVDAKSQSIGLDVARGKPVLIAMFYASCTVACPLLVSEVSQVLAELPADLQGEVQVLLVSFDPARDTPAKLAALARERKLGDSFTLAVGSETDTRTLAALLGIKYRKLANGDFAHGSTIVALDREGREIARAESLGQRDPLVRALIAYH
jgi:protein SCO1/2